MKNDIYRILSKYRTEIMGFAALWILFFHKWKSVFGDTLLGEMERFIAHMGYYGVDIFFFLSGMGLVYAAGKYTVREFYRRRFTKLLVPCVITVSMIALFRGWDFFFYIKTLIGYHFWMLDMYTCLWYLYASVSLYLLFPVYFGLLKKSGKPMLFTAGVLLVWFWITRYHTDWIQNNLLGFTNRIPVFLTGILTGEWAKQNRFAVRNTTVWCICIPMLVVGLITSYLTRYLNIFLLVPESNCFLPSYLIAISGSCILALILSWVEEHNLKMGKAIQTGLAFLGTISLEMYCIQEMALVITLQWLTQHCGVLVSNLLIFAGVILAAWLLHKLCLLLYQCLKFQ